MEDLSREHLIKWLRETMGEHVDFGEPMRQSFKLAADTIERLQKERDEGWENALCVQTERDQARNQFAGLAAQSQDEIDRLTVTANNNAAAHAKACDNLTAVYTSLAEIQDTHQKTFDDLAAARAEVESYQTAFAEGRARWVASSR